LEELYRQNGRWGLGFDVMLFVYSGFMKCDYGIFGIQNIEDRIKKERYEKSKCKKKG
jgi:hypothetical protein